MEEWSVSLRFNQFCCEHQNIIVEYSAEVRRPVTKVIGPIQIDRLTSVLIRTKATSFMKAMATYSEAERLLCVQ